MANRDGFIVGRVNKKYLAYFWIGCGLHKHVCIIEKGTGAIFIGTVRDTMDSIEVGSEVKIHCYIVRNTNKGAVSSFRRVKSVELIN